MIVAAVIVMHFSVMMELHESLIKTLELIQTATEVDMKQNSFDSNNSTEAATIHPFEQKGFLIAVIPFSSSVSPRPHP